MTPDKSPHVFKPEFPPEAIEEMRRGVDRLLQQASERGTIRPVPNQPRTPQRTVRIPDEVWDRAKAKADERGETVSDVVRRALERYGRAK